MEHVNNDMDDLFKKAGDLYPLRTSDSDWDSVLGKLKGEHSGDENPVPSESGRLHRFKRRWLLLLLFIPAGLAGIAYFSSSKKPSSALVLNQVDKSGQQIILNKSNQRGSETDLQSNNKKTLLDGKNTEPATKPFSDTKKQLRTSPVSNYRKKEVAVTRTKDDLSAPASGNYGSGNAGLLEIKNNRVSDSIFSSRLTASDAFKIKPVNTRVETRNRRIRLDFKNLPADSLHSATDGKKIDPSTHVSRGFYAGLVIGPDMSTIKFQSVKKLGFSIGVLVGYRFNKSFSVESGLLWDKKYYYTKGEYFNKSKTMMPPSEDVLNLNGYCNMFEIPLDLRYDFKKNADHGFFVKAGISAYLMKKEMYDINAKNNGMNVSYPAIYYNTSNSIFSVVQLSAGYEHALNKNTNIRIEPYLKIPVQGIGIGDMPISSAGFYLGITHSFR